MNPITRKEAYLAKIAGEETVSPLPTAVTGEEVYLKKIADTLEAAENATGILQEQLAALEQRVASLLSDNAGSHNAIYRGKYLGTAVTDAQYAAISVGTFEGLYIGDYWTIGGVDYRIAAFDYYYNCGDTACTTHHIVVVPDTCLYTEKMNSSAFTLGGYAGSAMHTKGLEQAKTTIKAAFAGHVLTIRNHLSYSVDQGAVDGRDWYNSEVELMNENMVYGSAIRRVVSCPDVTVDNGIVEKTQLPLFRHDPSHICIGDIWWLRDIIGIDSFAVVSHRGYAYRGGADYLFGVRPAFCIS